jgi:hypothetical protein
MSAADDSVNPSYLMAERTACRLRCSLLPHAKNPHTTPKRAPPESGFTDMLRVGALARIARPLLGFSLHAGDDSRDALSQLNAMLPDARGRDAELIRCGGGGRVRVGGALGCCPGDGGGGGIAL